MGFKKWIKFIYLTIQIQNLNLLILKKIFNPGIFGKTFPPPHTLCLTFFLPHPTFKRGVKKKKNPLLLFTKPHKLNSSLLFANFNKEKARVLSGRENLCTTHRPPPPKSFHVNKQIKIMLNSVKFAFAPAHWGEKQQGGISFAENRGGGGRAEGMVESKRGGRNYTRLCVIYDFWLRRLLPRRLRCHGAVLEFLSHWGGGGRK